jgi:hypothetical protein
VRASPKLYSEYLKRSDTLTTAGILVFQGTADGRFVAYDATTGKMLWETPTGNGVVAAVTLRDARASNSLTFSKSEQNSTAPGWRRLQTISHHRPSRHLPVTESGLLPPDVKGLHRAVISSLA